MHLMYVDESGDPGQLRQTGAQPSRHYILSGVIIPDEQWRSYLSVLVDIRRGMRTRYNLFMRAELHGAEIINPRGNSIYLKVGSRHDRVNMYREVLRQVSSRMPLARIINICLDKSNPRYASIENHDFEEQAWSYLIQRFSTFLKKTANGDRGMIFADQTNEDKVRKLLRKMRVFNSVPSRYGGSYSATVENIIEDPVMRNSKESYFVQIADLCAHALYRKEFPKGSLKRYNVDRLFDELGPLLLLQVSSKDPMGIVRA